MTELFGKSYAWNDPVIIASAAGILLTAVLRYIIRRALYRGGNAKGPK